MYKFIIKGLDGTILYTSICIQFEVSTAQSMGDSHLKLNEYPVGAQVDVIPFSFG